MPKRLRATTVSRSVRPSRSVKTQRSESPRWGGASAPSEPRRTTALAYTGSPGR
ncbi:MAG TPA: hypothetical protein VFJ82_03110 [Longimicrobium sp.]|nr:hypothetical protein [Longimicrobium sp.]